MRAIIRSLSGAATQQSEGPTSQMAFRYQMDVEVVPFNSFAPMTTNYLYYQNAPNMQHESGSAVLQSLAGGDARGQQPAGHGRVGL